MLPMLGISTLTGYISQFITMSPNFECNNRLDEVSFSINLFPLFIFFKKKKKKTLGRFQ